MKQDVLELMKQLDKDNIRTQMVLQCSPLFTGLKVSNLLIVPGEDEADLSEILEGTGIEYAALTELKDRTIFFLYRRERLCRWLEKEENRSFLEDYGFRDCTLDDILHIVSVRYRAYSAGHGAFPHEIGILLGYPVQDVKGFVVNDGRNYLCSGYWKVYGNLSEARKTFRKYELAKETLLRRILEGISIRNIIASCG